MRTIAVANQKGGCGKTTTAVNIAAALSTLGQRVLLIDFDPQAHATLGLGYNPDAPGRTLYDVLTNPQVPLSTVMKHTSVERLDLAPSNILLAGAELHLRQTLGKELVLGEQLAPMTNRYDVCIIDCPPSLGLLMINALVASSDVLIPVQAHFYALDGLKRLLSTICAMRERFHPCWVRTLGLLVTFVEDRTMLSKRVQLGMREIFGHLVFETVIHKSIILAEAPSVGQSISTYAPESRAAAEGPSVSSAPGPRMKQTDGILPTAVPRPCILR
jgi:chromosome partitioning protein